MAEKYQGGETDGWLNWRSQNARIFDDRMKRICSEMISEHFASEAVKACAKKPRPDACDKDEVAQAYRRGIDDAQMTTEAEVERRVAERFPLLLALTEDLKACIAELEAVLKAKQVAEEAKPAFNDKMNKPQLYCDGYADGMEYYAKTFPARMAAEPAFDVEKAYQIAIDAFMQVGKNRFRFSTEEGLRASVEAMARAFESPYKAIQVTDQDVDYFLTGIGQHRLQAHCRAIGKRLEVWLLQSIIDRKIAEAQNA